MGCYVVAEFLLTSASCGHSAIAEPLVYDLSVLLAPENIGIDTKISNVQLHVHLKNYSLKFKVLYLLNYPGY